ncbi:MAG: acyl-CoA thioesterase [Cytophagaceae bacterium]|nr:acyl-CoA thioesterase [Cytophagaceae bacterium]
MFNHQTTYRVRYADTDQMGFVYYGNYARLYEIGRVEALRTLGFQYRELEASGIWMPVYDLHCRFVQAARYDDLLTIRTTIAQPPTARMLFEYEVKNEMGTLLNMGQTTLIFVRAINQRPMPAPADLVEKLKPFFV